MFSCVRLCHMDFLKYSGKSMETDVTALYSPSGRTSGFSGRPCPEITEDYDSTFWYLNQDRKADRWMVTYRKMTAEDVPFISKLEEETFSMPWSADSFLEMIRKEDARYYVAQKDGQLVGGCGVLMIAGEGNITNVVVAPEAREQGVATGMLRHLMREGEREGLTAYTLEVRVSNAAAIHVYEKLGFVSAGIRPGFYEKPTEDAMIFWKR